MDEATLLGTAELPRQQGTLHLFTLGDTFTLTTDPAAPDWMNSVNVKSRQELAKLPCKVISKRLQPKVLIGGLGLSITLVEALKQLNLQAKVEVAEWLPEVVEWNEGAVGEALGFPLKDERVTVNPLDVARILRSRKGRYDAILLDTDNGPEDLLFKENDWLYTFGGLKACLEALEPMGVLAIWAKVADDRLKGKLIRAGFMVEQFNVPGNDDGSEEHVIWVAEKLQRD